MAFDIKAARELAADIHASPYRDVKMVLLEACDEIDRLSKVIDGFYDAIKHGEPDHELWLREKVDMYLGKSDGGMQIKIINRKEADEIYGRWSDDKGDVVVTGPWQLDLLDTIVWSWKMMAENSVREVPRFSAREVGHIRRRSEKLP